jgi:DNA-binding MarR family transcriptional regulator
MSRKLNKLKYRNIASECFLMKTRFLNRLITSMYEKKFHSYFIKASQFNLLVSLANFDSLQQKRLASFFKMEKSTLSRTLEGMESRGWIEMEKKGVNKKVNITKEGLKLIDQLYDDWFSTQKEIKALLGVSFTSTLSENHKKILKTN